MLLKAHIIHKLSFITVDFTAQMQYFMMRVANFVEPLQLRHFYKVSVPIRLANFLSSLTFTDLQKKVFVLLILIDLHALGGYLNY